MTRNDVVRTVEWALLMARLPGQEGSSAGVLLLDSASDELYVRLTPELAGAHEETSEFWRELSHDLMERSRTGGGQQVLDWLETTASHLIQLGSRHSIKAANPQETMNLLYRQHVICDLEVERPIEQELRRGAAH
jgi:hypothetical protein